MVGSVANIILDPIFIFGLKQGAAGAAIATVLGNLIADIYYLYVMIKKTNRLSVSIGDAKISSYYRNTGINHKYNSKFYGNDNKSLSSSIWK